MMTPNLSSLFFAVLYSEFHSLNATIMAAKAIAFCDSVDNLCFSCPAPAILHLIIIRLDAV